jgi:hypothetical protein
MQPAPAVAKPTRLLPASLRPLWEKQKANLSVNKTELKPKIWKIPRLTSEQRLASRAEKKAALAAE